MPDLKLSDTQLMLLSQAAQREDLLLVIPDTLKGGAVKAVVSKLMTHALVEEIAVSSNEPAWCKQDERPIGLKLTPASLEVLGIELDEVTATKPSDDVVPTGTPSRLARDGSKRALVVSMLAREKGATLDDLVQATGWLPHTTRAALTGLRQRGYEISREKGEGGSVYRITAGPAQAPAVEPVHAGA